MMVVPRFRVSFMMNMTTVLTLTMMVLARTTLAIHDQCYDLVIHPDYHGPV